MFSKRLQSIYGHSTEILKRTSLIISPVNAFWSLTPNVDLKEYAITQNPPDLYPLNFGALLKQGYFWLQDEQGLPVKPIWGQVVHNNSRLCAFALGNWNVYKQQNDNAYFLQVLKIADYFIEIADHQDRAFALRREIKSQGHKGEISALIQGQAMSVFTRCYEITKDKKYWDAALHCAFSFERSVENGGVVSVIKEGSIKWYEEYVHYPCFHVLNGIMSSLIGLFDLWKMTTNSSIKDLYDEGVKSVEKALPLYDCGWWSWYGLRDNGPHYLASMGYHSLHIWLLHILGTINNSSVMIETSERFMHYAKRTDFRLKNVNYMLQSKVKKYFNY